MSPVEHFNFCPRCGAPREGTVGIPFRCAACGFVYYFNPTVAAAVLVTRPDGRVLFITRAKDPARGQLAFPGGFIDLQESAEQGLRREVREEVGIEIGPLEFLCSCDNEYPYAGVTYPVLDLIFTAPALPSGEASPLDGVTRVEWLDPATVEPGKLAFPSLRAGLEAILRRAAATKNIPAGSMNFPSEAPEAGP